MHRVQCPNYTKFKHHALPTLMGVTDTQEACTRNLFVCHAYLNITMLQWTS